MSTTQADFGLEGKWTWTATGDQFILFGDTHHCLYHCNQIYSIHIQIDNIMTPIVYSFLPGKSQATYLRFLTLLKDKIFPTLPWYQRILIFHFTQAIWIKTQTFGLQIPYRDNDNDIQTQKDKLVELPDHVQEVPKHRPLTSYPQPRLRDWTHQLDADSAPQLLHLCWVTIVYFIVYIISL